MGWYYIIYILSSIDNDLGGGEGGVGVETTYCDIYKGQS